MSVEALSTEDSAALSLWVSTYWTCAEEFRIPGGSPSDEAASPPVRICTLLGDMLRDSGGRGAQSICVIMLALSALCTGPDGPNPDCQAECGPMTCRAAVQRLKEAAPEEELVIRHGYA